MSFLIILALAAIVFVVFPLVLKSNAIVAFFALCAGEVLVQLAGRDLTSIAKSVYTSSAFPMQTVVNLFLLLVAPLFTLFFLRKSVHGAKSVGQLIPGVCAAVLAALLVVQKLSFEVQRTIKDQSLYSSLVKFQTIAIILGLLTSLVVLFFERPKEHGHHKKH